MGMLICFLPWLIFWIFIARNDVQVAIYSGLGAALFFNLAAIARKQVPKALQLGALFFFLASMLIVLFVDFHTFRHWVNLASALTLLSITFFSIIIRKPFTLQFAREMAPKDKWGTPEFLRANYVITWVWVGVFTIKTAFAMLRLAVPSVPVWATVSASLCVFFAALKFTFWYKNNSKGFAECSKEDRV
ncbi:MAG: hypothetical protein PHE61_03265 [Candidatus Omnitrophica bacterium]|nr:hypothetical protein [Candidatus Omnitrophota bacterium]